MRSKCFARLVFKAFSNCLKLYLRSAKHHVALATCCLCSLLPFEHKLLRRQKKEGKCSNSVMVHTAFKQFCQQIDFMKKETKVQSCYARPAYLLVCVAKNTSFGQAGRTCVAKQLLHTRQLSTHKKYQSTRLSKLYSKGFVQDFYLKKGFSCQNTHHFPRINKLVVNKSSKEFVRDRLEILPSFLSLLLVTNQKILPRLALKSIAGFKLREKQIIGCKVTLRKFKSLELLERVTQLVLPLSRDFYGISATSFDFYGNLTIGCKESLLFPELSENFEFFERVGGFDLCLSISTINPVFKASSKESALLCTGMQLPLS